MAVINQYLLCLNLLIVSSTQIRGSPVLGNEETSSNAVPAELNVDSRKREAILSLLQQVDLDKEMQRMNDEMGKMMENMQRSAPAPVQNVDDWRLTENFRLENPIQQFGDGTRKFHLQFDMRQFKPEEIQVRTSGNTLTVGAKHDEKDPNKSVFREYNRSYVLPKDIQPERLTSKLSTGGVLTIEAPLPALEGPREKLIPIKHN